LNNILCIISCPNKSSILYIVLMSHVVLCRGLQKSLAKWHAWSTAEARYGMYELAFTGSLSGLTKSLYGTFPVSVSLKKNRNRRLWISCINGAVSH
jgi:hypothetical protein